MTKALNQIFNQLNEHFSSMTQEEKEKEWAEYDKYNSDGPTVNEYLNECLKTKKTKKIW